MSDSTESLWIVLQHGGSSTELYCSAYDTEENAQAFIESCRRATYECDGPFEVPLPRPDIRATHSPGPLGRKWAHDRIELRVALTQVLPFDQVDGCEIESEFMRGAIVPCVQAAVTNGELAISVRVRRPNTKKSAAAPESRA